MRAPEGDKSDETRTTLKFHKVDEDTIAIDRDLAKIKKSLLQKYPKLFRDELGGCHDLQGLLKKSFNF